MATLLHVDVSPNITSSVSRMLSAEFIKQWQTISPGDTIDVLDLAKNPARIIDADHLIASWGDDEALTEGQREMKAESTRLVNQFTAADIIVIGSPVYNLSIPAALKAYVDQIVVAGKTFKYTPNGVQGLLSGKKAYILFADGGSVEAYNAAGLNFFEPYMKAIFTFMGVTDVSTVCICARTPEAATLKFDEIKLQIAALL